jgi:hypothetical protein
MTRYHGPELIGMEYRMRMPGRQRTGEMNEMKDEERGLEAKQSI